MSLFLIGSVSRITSSIVLQLGKNKQYSKITIADLLPNYECHHRFYRLQKQMDNLQYGTQLSLHKLNYINDLLKQQNYDEVLYVTHDYYTSVVSKTKLMEQTAHACKNRKYLYFATPVEYDHFGYANPQQNYLTSENKVRQINPNATIIRSDVQDKTETLAYFNSTDKSYFQQKVFQSKFFFSPRVVKTTDYASIVAQVMAEKIQGKKFVVQGTEHKQPVYTDFSNQVTKSQYCHAKQNIVCLAQKYRAVKFENYEKFQLPKTRDEATQTRQ